MAEASNAVSSRKDKLSGSDSRYAVFHTPSLANSFDRPQYLARQHYCSENDGCDVGFDDLRYAVVTGIDEDDLKEEFDMELQSRRHGCRVECE
jgi:hypothetical protein